MLEPGALLDVRFRVAEVALGLAAFDGGALETRFPQRIAQGRALHVDGIVRVFPEFAAEGVASETAEEPALLVDPGSDVDRRIAGCGALGQGRATSRPVDDAHRPVEPSPSGWVSVCDPMESARPGLGDRPNTVPTPSMRASSPASRNLSRSQRRDSMSTGVSDCRTTPFP